MTGEVDWWWWTGGGGQMVASLLWWTDGGGLVVAVDWCWLTGGGKLAVVVVDCYHKKVCRTPPSDAIKPANCAAAVYQAINY